MKQSALIMLFIATLASCKKDDNNTNSNNNNNTPTSYVCPTCVTAPEAKSEHDAGSGGVYKGVIVGSSGTIALYLYNTGTEVKALVSFDGKSATFTTQSLSSWSPGQPISNALFTGTIDGKAMSAYFSVDANGQNPQVQMTIPGHTVNVAVYKETSKALVKNYEGTYTGDDAGTFNMTLNGNDYSIVVSGGGILEGSLVNGAIDHLTQKDQVEVKGTFNGDDVSGTWKDTKSTKQGTWSGKRTL